MLGGEREEKLLQALYFTEFKKKEKKNDHSGFCSYHVLVSRAEAQKQHQQQSAHSHPGVHLGFCGFSRFFGTACMSHRELRVYIPWRGGGGVCLRRLAVGV